MNKIKKIFSILIVSSAFLFAESKIPVLEGTVTDNAKIMSRSQKDEISSYLNAIDNQYGTQIAILTIPSLNGEDIESYSMRVAENWKLGQKGKDNGVLVLLALAEHQVRIEVGYGLEESLTDAYCGLVIRKVMIPYFQDNSYAQGLAAGVKAIAQKIGGVPSEQISQISEEEDNEGLPLPAFAFLVVWFLMLTMGIGQRVPILRWLPWVAFAMRHRGSSSHYSGSNFNSFSSGSFHDFGGGSSGGFSGGGGSFGGGGASGSW